MWYPIFNTKEKNKMEEKIREIANTLMAVNYKEIDLRCFKFRFSIFFQLAVFFPSLQQFLQKTVRKIPHFKTKK
ncbi:MAG: hypothetical protein B6I20_02100 [Bacteroidetes bacterium 4572_117]|nr:MAG: hypothetical protein B6I20_02100 [Bacteroidetes bacterium 4572_117]